MIRILTFYRRRPDLSHEEFLDYWRDIHGPLVAGAEGVGEYLKRYIQHHLTLDPILTTGKAWVPVALPDYPFDGFSECWFESYEDRNAFFAMPEIREKFASDEANFMDMTTPRMMFEDRPVVVYDLPRDDWPNPLKLLGFYKRRPDITREKFRERTRSHGFIVAETPGSGDIIRNNTLHHVFLDPLVETPEKYWAPIWKPEQPDAFPFDSFSDAWFRDIAARDTFIDEPHLRDKVVEDERGFIDMEATRLMFIDNEIVPFQVVSEWPEPIEQTVKF